MSSAGLSHSGKRCLNNPTLGQEIHWEVWCLQLGHHSLGNAYQRNSHARSETLQCSLYWPCTVRNKVKLEVPCTSLTYCTWWYILYCIVRSEGPCTSWPCQIRNQGWALRSFPFGTLRSFPFLKKNLLSFSVLFWGFWRLMRPKRTQRTQRSFAKFGKERKERNVLLQRMEKNARTFRSFAKERENVPFFCKRMWESSNLFSIYIQKYI